MHCNFYLKHFLIRAIIKSFFDSWAYSLKRTLLLVENIFFIIRFHAIMHRTTIVRNKIISIICSCLFFCLANIYRPSLGKEWLGRPNPPPTTTAQFLSQKKKKSSIQNCMHYNFQLKHILIRAIIKKLFWLAIVFT